MSTSRVSDVTEPRPRRRLVWRRIWQALHYLVLAVAVFVVGSRLKRALDWQAGAAELRPIVAELDASDPDWRMADLCAKRNAGLPLRERNSFQVARAASDAFPEQMQRWWESRRSDEELTVGHLPSPQFVEGLGCVLPDCEEAISEALRVVEFPDGGHPLTFAEPTCAPTPTGHHDATRRTVCLLASASQHTACEGDGRRAADCLLARLAFARSVGDEPCYDAQSMRGWFAFGSVTSLEWALGVAEMPDDKLAAWQTAAEAEAAAPRTAFAARGHRATFFRFLENVDNRRIRMDTLKGSFGCGDGARILTHGDSFRGYIPSQQARGLELFTRYLAAARKPFGPARRAEVAAIDADKGERPVTASNAFLDVFLPDFTRWDSRDAAVVASLRCSVAAVACERFRMRSGRFPDSLAELPVELLAAIPEDPYTGLPLRFKTTENGLVVYSVGADLADNGGKLGRLWDADSDIGFKLLDPKHRRQPPKPRAEPPPDE